MLFLCESMNNGLKSTSRKYRSIYRCTCEGVMTSYTAAQLCFCVAAHSHYQLCCFLYIIGLVLRLNHCYVTVLFLNKTDKKTNKTELMSNLKIHDTDTKACQHNANEETQVTKNQIQTLITVLVCCHKIVYENKYIFYPFCCFSHPVCLSNDFPCLFAGKRTGSAQKIPM